MVPAQKQIQNVTTPPAAVRNPLQYLSDFYTGCVKRLATRSRISQSKLDQIIRSSLLTLSAFSLFLIALRNDWMILLIVGLSYFLVGSITLILIGTEADD